MSNIVYTIGDSHSQYVPNQSPFYVTYHTWVKASQAPTAYGLRHEITKSGVKEKALQLALEVPTETVFILSFGEVDCRFHIYYHSVKMGIPYVEIIQDILDYYQIFITNLQDRGIRPIILGIPPCGRSNLSVTLPIYPLKSQQIEIYKLYNDMMKLRFDIINIYDYTVNRFGLIQQGYIYDKTHLNSKIYDEYIQPWLINHNVI